MKALRSLETSLSVYQWTRHKLRIFRSNVKSVLLYGSETWKVAKTIISKLQVFVNRCLRRILNIHWPEVISNEELFTFYLEEYFAWNSNRDLGSV